MKKIDELILKVLELNPHKLHEKGDNKYYLFYKDITLCFFNLTGDVNSAFVIINLDDACNISKSTISIVLKYFNKKYTQDDLLNKINKDLRKEKLLTINEE